MYIWNYNAPVRRRKGRKRGKGARRKAGRKEIDTHRRNCSRITALQCIAFRLATRSSRRKRCCLGFWNARPGEQQRNVAARGPLSLWLKLIRTLEWQTFIDGNSIVTLTGPRDTRAGHEYLVACFVTPCYADFSCYARYAVAPTRGSIVNTPLAGILAIFLIIPFLLAVESVSCSWIYGKGSIVFAWYEVYVLSRFINMMLM